jgi:hypothetical protein
MIACPKNEELMLLRTGSATDIVEGEVSDAGVHLEEERERLANTTSSTENGDLGKLHIAVSTWSNRIEAIFATVKPKDDFMIASRQPGRSRSVKRKKTKPHKAMRNGRGESTYVPGGGGESTALDARSGEHLCD